ncbi:MAG: SusD/RagB family nutrient-binding outer membrane lipoprotein [Bacteroidia bacterium]
MKNLYKVLFLSLILVSTSCNEFFDINDDPNNPSDVSIDLLLPGAQSSMMVTFGGDYGTLGGYWAQYYTQAPDAGQYEDYDEYNVPSDKFDNQWQEAYAGGLNDLQIIRDKATESGDNAYYLIATLIQAYSFQMLADLYNDVPFNDALKGSLNFNPKFDNGADIYPALLSRIDDAVSRYNSGGAGLDPGTRDIIYGGDMAEWVRFANTLKLKMYMRMAYTSSADAAAVNALIADDNFITKDAKFADFGAEQGKRNPYYEIQVSRLGDVNNRASLSMLQMLQLSADPRIDGIYVAGSAGHKAKIQGDFANRDIPNGELSTPNIGATDPVYFMMVAEKDFLVAEALVRYASGSGAKAAYEAGIEASFAMHGVSGASALYGTGGTYEFVPTGDVETDIGPIMVQKWIALANFMNLEGFFERNRTQYPPFQAAADQGMAADVGELTYSFGSVLPQGKSPRRLLVPDREVQRNTNAPAQIAQGIGVKVWWDKK